MIASIALATYSFAWLVLLAAIVVSASQIEAFRTCPRKWSWRSRYGIEAPSGAGAALGDAVHKQLEDYLRFGKRLDLTSRAGILALELLPYLPAPPQPGVEISFDDYPLQKLVEEDDFTRASVPHRIRGRIDLWTADGITDHKTTKAFHYACTDLTKNPQAVIYARIFMHATGATSAVCRWNYVNTTNRKTLPVHQTLTLDNTREEWHRILADVEAMAFLADTPTASMVPVISACSHFGGCAYQQLCNLPPEASFIAAAEMHARRRPRG